jgi:hypothetical protein
MNKGPHHHCPGPAAAMLLVAGMSPLAPGWQRAGWPPARTSPTSGPLVDLMRELDLRAPPDLRG